MEARMMNTRSAIATTQISRKPISTMISATLTSAAMAAVIWKLSASLPWSSTNGISFFLICQITSGPMIEPNGMMQPASADRWANIAHCFSSALGVPSGAGGGAVTLFGGGTLFGGTLMEDSLG